MPDGVAFMYRGGDVVPTLSIGSPQWLCDYPHVIPKCIHRKHEQATGFFCGSPHSHSMVKPVGAPETRAGVRKGKADGAQATRGLHLSVVPRIVHFMQTDDNREIEIRRSTRRRKSVAAFREGGKTVIVAPARMSSADVELYARELVERLDKRATRESSNADLHSRAQRLVNEYLDIDILATHPAGVTIEWVTNQNSRWGSCTSTTGAIRLSHRMQGMPDYVIDSVLFHEVCHLLVANHGEQFQVLVSRFPHNDRADEYLRGYAFAERRRSED